MADSQAREAQRFFRDFGPISPNDRVAGGFGAMGVMDRQGYPGSFLDPETAKHFLGSPGPPAYSGLDPYPRNMDLSNPLSVGLGVRNVMLPYEKDSPATSAPSNDRSAAQPLFANPGYPYDPVGALGGIFAPAYIAGNQASEAAVARWTAAHQKAPPPPDPPFKMPAPADNSKAASGEAARNAITQAIIQGGGDGGLGPSATPGFTTLGRGDPDNPTQPSTPTDPDNPTVNAPPTAPPNAPPTAPPAITAMPDKGTPADDNDEAQAALSSVGPALAATLAAMNPTMTAPDAPDAPALGPNGAPQSGLTAEGLVGYGLASPNAPAPAPPSMGYGYGLNLGAPSAALGPNGAPQSGLTAQGLMGYGLASPNAPAPPAAPPAKGEPTAEKGEPTAEEDAAELAAVNAQAVAEGFMGPEGEPGHGVSVTGQTVGPQGQLGQPTAFAPAPPNISISPNTPNLSFAPDPSTLALDPNKANPLDEPALTPTMPALDPSVPNEMDAPAPPAAPMAQSLADSAHASVTAQQAQQATIAAAMQEAQAVQADIGTPPAVSIADPTGINADLGITLGNPTGMPPGTPQAAVAPAPTPAQMANAVTGLTQGLNQGLFGLVSAPQSVTNDAIAQTAVDNAMAAMNSNIGFQMSNMDAVQNAIANPDQTAISQAADEAQAQEAANAAVASVDANAAAAANAEANVSGSPTGDTSEAGQATSVGNASASAGDSGDGEGGDY